MLAVFGQQKYYEVYKLFLHPLGHVGLYWPAEILMIKNLKMFNFVGQFWEPLWGYFGNTQIFTGTALSIRRGNLGLVATPSQFASAHRKIDPEMLYMQETIPLTLEVRWTASVHKKFHWYTEVGQI